MQENLFGEVKHTCHAPHCDTVVPPERFSCTKHWYAIPKELRDDIWKHYREGQEIDKRPSPEYMRAALRAQIYLAVQNPEVTDDERKNLNDSYFYWCSVIEQTRSATK